MSEASGDVQPPAAVEQDVLSAAASEPLSPFSAGAPLKELLDGTAVHARAEEAVPAAGAGSAAAAAAEHKSASDASTSSAASGASSSSSTDASAASAAAAVPDAATIAAAARASYSSTPLSKTPAFINFRANVPRQRVAVGKNAWAYFDLGPRDVPPLLCLPGTSGTAESFFNQVMSLGNRGYRVVAASPPAYFSHDEWCNGLNGFIAALNLGAVLPSSSAAASSASSSTAASSSDTPRGQVHIFANGLSGYMCLYYLSHILPSKNHIASLILCNAFLDTSAFQAAQGSSPWCLALLKRAPDFVVKKLVLDSLPQRTQFPEAVDFQVEELERNMPRDVLASRLTLHLAVSRGVNAPHLWRDRAGQVFPQERITILDSTDESVLPEAARQRLYDTLSNARLALMKEGGDFPFLAVPDEVNLHVTVHLRAQGIFPSLKDSSSAAANSAAASASPHSVTAASPSSSSFSSASAAASSTRVVSSSPTVGSLSSPTTFLPLSFAGGGAALSLLASGYGHEDDEHENDSIFLTKNAASPPAAASTNAAGGQMTSSLTPSFGGTAARSPSFSLAQSNALNSVSEKRDDAERVALLRAIQAEEEQRLARQQALAAERAARQAAADAAARERIEAEGARAARHSSLLEGLFDADASAVEQKLTQRTDLLDTNTQDLF